MFIPLKNKEGGDEIKTYRLSFKDRIKSIDPILFWCSLAISLLSLVTLVCGYEVFGARRLIMQLAMTLIGIVIIFFIANIDYQEVVDKLYIAMFLGSVALMAVVILFGNAIGGNKSWITVFKAGSFEVGIQPSEFVKATFIVSFSKHLDLVKHKINKIGSIVGLLLHAGIIVGLILISGDLGVALVYMGIIAVMLFCAGLSGWYFLGAGAVVLIAFPFIWDHLQPYQQERFLAGFNPDLDPLGRGLHQIVCRRAIANGGVFGKGFSGATVYESLFAADTDCIFATYCEMFGLIGAIILMALYVVIIVRIIWIARSAGKDSGAFICAGVVGMMLVQTVENIGMNLCMLPVVGITLPFMSAGGSSVLAIYILFGMVHSVRARKVNYYSERMSDKL